MAGQKFTDGAGSGAAAPTTYGVWGDSDNGDGVLGISAAGTGVDGRSYLAGVFNIDSTQPGGTGVYGENNLLSGFGVRGAAPDGGIGVDGVGGAAGVSGSSPNVGVAGSGSVGMSGTGAVWGVFGTSQNGTGAVGTSTAEYGVSGLGGNIGVYAHNYTVQSHSAYLASRCCAGDFYGPVAVHGQLWKQSGGFQIDHPLDPANKYLFHSFVESSDMKNMYDGVVSVNAKGEAVVKLPAWVQALNSEFRYQLTPIGGPAPNLHVAEGVANNQFKIAGGTARMEVSWQLTGIRTDAWARDNRISVEKAKPSMERGSYLHPEGNGQPASKHIQWARYPDLAEQVKKQADMLRSNPMLKLAARTPKTPNGTRPPTKERKRPRKAR